MAQKVPTFKLQAHTLPMSKIQIVSENDRITRLSIHLRPNSAMAMEPNPTTHHHYRMVQTPCSKEQYLPKKSLYCCIAHACRQEQPEHHVLKRLVFGLAINPADE